MGNLEKLEQFAEGRGVSVFRLANGGTVEKVRVGKPLMAAGLAKDMTIVMQPSHGGMAPWIFVEWGEPGVPDEYFNVAAVQSITLL